MSWPRRPPDFVIGGPERPYMLRWWLIPKNRYFNVYLHKILRDDDDRALHDHPWWNVSIVLKGSYDEVVPNFKALKTPFTRMADTPTVTKRRGPGSVIFRRATTCHRLVIPVQGGGQKYCWSLFITGPTIRKWGFHCPQGWKYYRDYVAPDDKGAVGKGCEE